MRNVYLYLTVFFSISFSFNSFAENPLDTKLSEYVKKFNFRPVEIPAGKNIDLFLLGKALFFEKEVAGNRDISCATCHHPDTFTGDGLPLPIGTGGKGLGLERVQVGNADIVPRNSPPLYNVGHRDINKAFWDARVRYNERAEVFTTPEPALNGDYPLAYEITDQLGHAIDAQALFPPTSHIEMRGAKGENELADAKSNLDVWSLIMKRLLSQQKYRDLFKAAYPNSEKLNIGHFGKALGHFQTHEFSVTMTPWDQYLRGDKSALSVKEKRGALVFVERGRCVLCHQGRLLGGNVLMGVASPQTGPGVDIRKNDQGVFEATGVERHQYLFKTPMLRNVALTAPYFHSGVYKTLKEVINHYDGGVKSLDKYDSSWLREFTGRNYKNALFVETDRYKIFRKKESAHPILRSRGIRMTEMEKSDLLKFLEQSLTEK
ncbi:hypothetical protein A9Q84_15325 [Halobacteriovorax marinus]|uniref:Cytochrome c domain-containing protein n=1 Tax=Halobacteriovorax marinus TaxID=97084 RepID=A0A1Y5F5M5_9BACT|nr:hypothetical protein A9Q84_15325 [Halobacteriovorax marinus]